MPLPLSVPRALRGAPLAPALTLALVLASGWPLAARAEYRLSGGDTLDITVFRVPDLNRQAVIDDEGRIAFPPLGHLEVAGATPEEVSARIREMLAREEILSDAKVTVALAAARPVFVGGDVSSPGAYPYQSDLSVRRAIALAGGLGISRDGGLDRVAELRAERDALATELLRERARAARLAAEIAGEEALRPDELARGSSAGAELPEARRAEILGLEAQRLEANLAEARESKAHLERTVELTEERLDALTAQQAIQSDLMERQRAEIERMRGIADRGLAVQSSVQDEQRAFNAMQERASDTATDITAARGALEDASFELRRFDDRRRAALGSEMQEALLAIEGLGARLRGLRERLAQLGFSEADRLAITLHRSENGEATARPATPDTVLRPGDMVEVAIDLSAAPEAPSQ